jgi:hypothetical protein
MITIEYLRKLLGGQNGLPSVTRPSTEVIDSPDIMDGLTELAQHKSLPFAVLFEEAFHYDDDAANDVPVTRYTQSIYVMRMASGKDPKRPEEAACMADIKRIRALLLARWFEGDKELAGWDKRAQRDFVEGAANYVGWKLKLTFTENESWEV